MSRTAKIARALTIGYGFQLTVAVVGVVLTPFFLSRLGTVTYGQWLIVSQVLGLLGLLDLGVTAILGREVAAASGSPDSERAVAEVVRRAAWLVWFQTPVVVVAAVVVWLVVAAPKEELAGPLGVVLAAFALVFPFRLFGAVLNGLQDLTFTAAAQAVGWVVTTTVSVGLVIGGLGLYALAVGWLAGQGFVAVLSYRRLRSRFPSAWSWNGRPPWRDLGEHLRPSAWASLLQLAQLLLNGAELIVIGILLGPAAVVVYSCTTKLIVVLNQQPYLLVSSSLPAVAEIRGMGDRARLLRACQAVGLGVVGLSGAIALCLVVVTPAFVPLWVGPEQYGGPALTLLAVVAMSLRHWVFTLSQTVFALGYTQRLAWAAIGDGVVTVAATAGWVAAVGLIGVPLGSLTGVLLTNGPVGLLSLAAAIGASPVAVAGWVAGWAVRFAVVFVPVAVLSFTSVAGDPVVAGVALVGGLLAYLLLMRPLADREPLKGYWVQMVAAVRRRFGLTPRKAAET